MIWYRSLKKAAGFTLAVVLAYYLNLDFYISAGIIAILNMMDTRRASARVALKRLYAAAIGLILDMVAFRLLGFDLWVLILLVTIFIPLAFKLNVREGVAIHIVLSSHFMAYGTITLVHAWNEYLLVIIGAAVALLLNLHMPNKTGDLIQVQKQLEAQIRMYILNLAYDVRNMCLFGHDDVTMEDMMATVERGMQVALEYRDNYYLKEPRFYLEYFQMRSVQLERLKYMAERLQQVVMNLNEARMLGSLTEELAEVFDLNNDGKALLRTVQRLKEDLRQMDLPQTMFEMEQKSFLIQYTMDLEEFIAVKVRFSERFL